MFMYNNEFIESGKILICWNIYKIVRDCLSLAEELANSSTKMVPIYIEVS